MSQDKISKEPFGFNLQLKFSSKEIKTIIRETINAEDKQSPVTDDTLTEILNQKGYKIARRTVAKYREQLNIPVARLRREL